MMKKRLSFLFLLISVSTYATDHVKIKYRYVYPDDNVVHNYELNYDGQYYWTEYRDGNDHSKENPIYDYHKEGVPYIVFKRDEIKDDSGNPKDCYRFLDSSLTPNGAIDGRIDFNEFEDFIRTNIDSKWKFARNPQKTRKKFLWNDIVFETCHYAPNGVNYIEIYEITVR